MLKQRPTRQWHRGRGVLERNEGSWNHAEQRKTRVLIYAGGLLESVAPLSLPCRASLTAAPQTIIIIIIMIMIMIMIITITIIIIILSIVVIIGCLRRVLEAEARSGHGRDRGFLE